MSRDNKFANLHRYFSELNEDELTMTFKEMENIIGENLSKSAYQYPAYWYDSKTHMLPKSWIENGYKMEGLSLKEQKVTFRKISVNTINKNTYIEKSNTINVVKRGIRNQPTITIDKVLVGINKFYSDLEADENARYLSWEHCYKQFIKGHNKENLTDEDIDYLSLHLAFYLASWGMLRGSSFLLQKDYRVHIDIVKELYKPIYSNLWAIDYKELQEKQNLDNLMILIDRLKTIYRDKRKNIKEVDTDISDILITKVLLGTMGCVAAYDEYFKRGVGKYKIAAQLLGTSSVKGLAEFYDENSIELEKVRNEISAVRGVEYPQMKILDMAFFQLGFDYK